MKKGGVILVKKGGSAVKGVAKGGVAKGGRQNQQQGNAAAVR